jgi:hypothetical protein
MTTVTGIQRQLEDPGTSPGRLGPIHSVHDLRSGPDTWHLRGLALGLDRYLNVLDDHQLHRELILFHDQFARFENWRDVHLKSFHWMLDNSDKWKLPAGQERLEQIATARIRITDALNRCLAHGLGAVLSLATIADSSPRLNRLHQGTVNQYLRLHYGMSLSQLQAKAAAAALLRS